MDPIEQSQPLKIVPSSPDLTDTTDMTREAAKLIETRRDKLEELESSVEIASNTEGKIQEVIFQRSGDYFDFAYISFLQNRPDILITMVVSSEEEKRDFLGKMKIADIPSSRCRFIVMGVNDKDISVWARDSYVMTRTSDGKNVVMEPRGRTYYPGHGDRDVADRIVATTGERLITSPLIFDGGDMRASGKYLFVGAITIIQNIPAGELATPENVQKVVAKFKKQFGKEVIVVGFTQKIDEHGNAGEYLAPLKTDMDKAEPVFHLDLYFTPLSNNTIAIADPQLTKEILEKMKDTDFDKATVELQKYEDNTYLIERTIGALKQFRNATESLSNQEDLDRIAADMKSQGFNVIRIPYFQRYVSPISYNNALVENFLENGKQITQISLPQYGIKELDESAVHAYERAGVRVLPINGLFRGIDLMGALNCLTSEKRK